MGNLHEEHDLGLVHRCRVEEGREQVRENDLLLLAADAPYHHSILEVERGDLLAFLVLPQNDKPRSQ
jgi:hypothetical protein